LVSFQHKIQMKCTPTTLNENLHSLSSSFRDSDTGSKTMDNFLSDVLQCNILPYLLFHETRRISRVCSLFNSVVARSRHYGEPSEDEIQQNVEDWIGGASKYRKHSMDILQVDNDAFNTFTFQQRSYLAYFMIFQRHLYSRMPQQFVDLINTRKISLKNVSTSTIQRRRLIDFVCNVLEFIRVPVANHLCSVNYLDEYNNAAGMTINSLDLSGNNLTDHDVMSICDAISRRFHHRGKYTLLKHISLKGNEGITDESMKKLFQILAEHCPFLKSIDLSGTSVTNQCCVYIHKHLIVDTMEGKGGRPLNVKRYNLRKPMAIHIKLYGTKVDQSGAATLNHQMGKDLGGNAVRIKAYWDNKTEPKRKVQSQRNLRDLIQKMRR